MSAHDFSFKDIDGELLKLSRFASQPLLIVNTASECAYTPQYAELETLWTRYRTKGLAVVGVPSNDFGAQEPGNAADIKHFCQTNYAVDFPLTQKQRVIGADAHPFYQWVVDEIGEVAAPKWNFHKYLIGPDGSLAGLWPSDVSPLDLAITEAIDGLLSP
ncbi:MAG: glutathione peroxidase [Gammaproteobacteria bacterium]|nr:glutathione peroxidase [Gammaproteobacteria bacterium]